MASQMKAKRRDKQPREPTEALRAMSQEENEAGFSLLFSCLDVQLIFGLAGLEIEAMQPLFEAYWRGVTLAQTGKELVASGLLNAHPGPGYSVPSDRLRGVATECESYLMRRRFRLPGGCIEFGLLLEDFSRYSSQEWNVKLTAETSGLETWGGRVFSSGNRLHHLLLRPHPLELRAHKEAFILILCSLPDGVIQPIADQFVRRRALRQRLAVYDLERCQKINLTRSDVFIFFERYLRRVHGLRLSPPMALTQGLADSGVLSLQMG